MKTGEILLYIMACKGISKRELSRKTDISLPTISRLIHGDLNGNIYTWAAICKALKVPLDIIISNEQKTSNEKIEQISNSEQMKGIQ